MEFVGGVGPLIEHHEDWVDVAGSGVVVVEGLDAVFHLVDLEGGLDYFVIF